MDDLTKKHLQDILTAIEEVESFFSDTPKVYDDFYSNLCLRRAVERNFFESVKLNYVIVKNKLWQFSSTAFL